jgi:hypothetical protein
MYTPSVYGVALIPFLFPIKMLGSAVTLLPHVNDAD